MWVMASVPAPPTCPVSLMAVANVLDTVSTTALATSPVPLMVVMIPLFTDSTIPGFCSLMIAPLSSWSSEVTLVLRTVAALDHGPAADTTSSRATRQDVVGWAGPPPGQRAVYHPLAV